MQLNLFIVEDAWGGRHAINPEQISVINVQTLKQHVNILGEIYGHSLYFHTSCGGEFATYFKSREEADAEMNRYLKFVAEI